MIMSRLSPKRFLIPLLLAAAPLGANAEPLPADLVSSMRVGKMAAPPLIDGLIGEKEWADATAVSGVADQKNNLLVPRPSTFWLGWDKGHLYLACRVYIRPGYRLRVPAGRSEGLAYIWDDGLEVGFAPRGANVPSGTTQNAYKWFMNALGFGGDYSRIAVGQQFKNWTPRFQMAARLTDPGTAPDGGRWWELEFSSTPEDFELTGPHRAGDQWKMLLGVNHFPAFLQARVPCNGAYLDPAGHTSVVLAENSPSVQLLDESLENLATKGTSQWTVRANNPTDKSVTLKVVQDVLGESKETSLTVPAGQTAETKIVTAAPTGVTEGLVSIKVSQGETVLLNYATRFQVGYLAQILAPPAPPKEAFAFSAQFNPLKTSFLIQGDTFDLADPTQAKELRYRISRKGDEKPVAEGVIQHLADFYLRDLVQLPSLKPGEYTVEATLALKDGTLLGPEKASFLKKNEAEVYKAWWNNQLGNPNRVIPPFSALTKKNNQVSCWGREYQLDALGLPQGIVSQGQPVLAQAARVVATIGGKEVRFPLNASPTFTASEPWRITFTGKTRGGGIVITSKGWIEQDGLTYVELTYEPEGKEAVEVQSLRLEFPLRGEDAESLLCIGPGENFSARTSLLLPPDKQGTLWSTLITGRNGSQMTVGSFYPEVWIGNDRRGFLWWGDNDRGWVPNNDIPAHEVVREGTDIVLRNNLIGTPNGAKPFVLNAPRTLAFGYMASPFRPLPQGWRNAIASEDGTFWQPYRGVNKDSKTGDLVFPKGKRPMHVNWIHPETRYPEEWSAMWAAGKIKADQKVDSLQMTDPYRSRNGTGFVHLSFQLIGYGEKSSDAETFKYFGSEWADKGRETYNQEMQDYFLWMFDQAFAQGGLRTVYFDLAFPILNRNLQSGLGYELPDGRIQPGYNGFNIRRFLMRLSALMNDHGLMPGGIGLHSSNAYLLIAMPWVDAVLDGEYHFLNDASTMDWVDGYPTERMRAFSSPHNWGVGINWMQLVKFTDPERKKKTLRAMAEYVWMHDSWLNPQITGFGKMPDSILDWGLNQNEVIYHPYWRNSLVTTKDPDILVSTWQLSDRLLIGVFNNSRDKARPVNLKVDLDAAKLRPQLPWQQFLQIRDLWKAEADGAAVLDGKKETIEIPKLEPHTGRLIGIRLY